MQKSDSRVPLAVVFCCLGALTIGCGANAKESAQPDALLGVEQGHTDKGNGLNAMADVTFRLENTGTRTLYMHSGCTPMVRVRSIADGTVYENGFFCACDCDTSSCTGQPACGACPSPSSGDPIDAGSAKDIIWPARLTTTQTKTGSYGSFQCLVHSPIPTGPYEVEVDLYTNVPDSAAKINPLTFTKSFVLGTERATLEIPIQ